MAMSRPLKSLILELAKHEAGHYVVGRTLGFDVGGISLKMLDAHGGHSGTSTILLSVPTKGIEEVVSYLRKRLAVLYAGVVAQVTVDGVPDQNRFVACLKQGAAGDKSKADELLNVLRNVICQSESKEKFESELTNLETEAIQQALEIIVSAKSCVDNIAALLASRVKTIGQEYTVSRAEIEQLPTVIAEFSL